MTMLLEDKPVVVSVGSPKNAPSNSATEKALTIGAQFSDNYFHSPLSIPLRYSFSSKVLLWDTPGRCLLLFV